MSMEFSRQEYGVSSHALLQGIFPTQGSNLGLPHCRQILYHLSHQGTEGGTFLMEKQNKSATTRVILLLLFSCSVMSLCNPMYCSTPGFPVLHYLPELTQTHVHWVNGAIQPSCLLLSLLLLLSFQATGSFPLSQLFASDGQSIGASASLSIPPMNIQDWFPLGLTGLISLQSKGLSRVFSNTTV